MCRIISFLSAKGGLGKTSLISMLGEELSKCGKKVCMFDGIFALNDLSLISQKGRGFDLCEYLAGNIGVYDVINKSKNNLFFLKTNNPRFDYLKCSELIQGFILEISLQFDYILIEVNSFDVKNLNLFLKVSSEAFLIASQDRQVLLNSIKLLNKIKNYKNITNIKLVINKFKVISALKMEALSEEEISLILKEEILFSFPKFLKYNIFTVKTNGEYYVYSRFFARSVEENFWIKIDYKRKYKGLIGKIKRQIYFKFE